MPAPPAIAAFLSRCDLLAPPAPEGYVERSRFSTRVHARLGGSESGHILLLGQLGVGKSTELWALERQLSSTYCVIRPPAGFLPDLAITGWPEIFVYVALWAADTQRAPGASPAQALENALGQEIYELARKFKFAGVGSKSSPTLLQRFHSDLTEIKKTISAAPSMFWDLAASVVRELETHAGRPALLLLDGLEKAPDATARSLFQEQRRWLSALPLRAVITAPVWLSFEPFFGDVEQAVSAVERLRALETIRDTPGWEFLVTLASKRGALGVFSAVQLEEAITWSGGLPRQFLQILAEAASRALSDGLDAVTPVCMMRARRRVAERFQYQLGPEDFAELAKGDTERSRTARASLLRVGALIEVEDAKGSLRFAINPLVDEIMKTRRAEAQGAAR